MKRATSYVLRAVFLMLPVIVFSEVIRDDGRPCSFRLERMRAERNAQRQQQNFDGRRRGTRPVLVPMPAMEDPGALMEEVKKSARAGLDALRRLKGVLNGLIQVSHTPCCLGGPAHQDCKIIETEELVSDGRLVRERVAVFEQAMDDLVSNVITSMDGVRRYRRMTGLSPDIDLGLMDGALQRVVSDYQALKQKMRNTRMTLTDIVLGDRLTSQVLSVTGERLLLAMRREGLSMRSVINIAELDHLKASLGKLSQWI